MTSGLSRAPNVYGVWDAVYATIFIMSSVVKLATTGFISAGPCSFAEALLHVKHLAHQVAGRAAGETGHWAEAFQIGAVATTAGDGFAATFSDQRLALLHRADGQPQARSHRLRVRIAQNFRRFGIDWRFLEIRENRATSDPVAVNQVRTASIESPRNFRKRRWRTLYPGLALSAAEQARFRQRLHHFHYP